MTWLKNKTFAIVSLVLPAVIIIVAIGFLVLRYNKTGRPLTHSEIAGPPNLKANANSLTRTLITPHLEHEIQADKNLLWCATAQVAWNELCNLIGEDVHLENEPEMVSILNKKTVTAADLDEASYIAMAGTIDQDIFGKIQTALEKKFKGQASPELVPLPSSDLLWVAYSYLFKALPFEWAFERLKSPLSFQGVKVECFGIEQFLTSQKNEVKAASQVLIYDYKSEDDFVIELKTRSKTDRLILAKVPPETTLAQTIATVQKRVANSNPEKMQVCSSLMVPVLNFELMREYNELYNKPILSKNQLFNGSIIILAKQHIRFKLDETGAVLKSEALFAAGIGGDLLFNKPFLIMIQRTDTLAPYFALWVANDELLVKAQ